ncbi:MAG: S8 family serine peptidase [Solirubrobacterales bacterium]
MSEVPQFKGSLVASLIVAIALASLLSPAAGAVVLGPKQHGPLAPALQKLSKPAVAGKAPAQQAAALGLPEKGPGSLIREGRRVLVEVHFDGGVAPQLDALHEAEAKVVVASRPYKTVTAAVSPAALREIAAIPGVGAVVPVQAPILADVCEGGSVISEGVAQINAKAAREAFPGLDGEGVTVGVLSDSYDKASGTATHAPEDVETADLPGLANPCSEQKTPVDVRQDLEPTPPGLKATDEGRAMLQIVHDVAPDANLAFATAFLGETAFAESIEELAAPFPVGAGAKVIVDDIAYPEEPFFQDGPVAAAVNKVTSEGVTYLSAAGNDNLIDASGRDIASWEAPSFRDAGSCPAVVQGLSGFNGTHCMDFAPSSGVDTTFGITVNAGATLRVGLQWAEPWFGVGTDMDAFLLNADGSQILEAAFVNNTTETERPSEFLAWKNETGSAQTVQFVINRFSGGGSPRLKFILMQNGGGVSATEYPTSTGGDEVGPSVFGHAGSASAIAVGAVPFDDSSQPERYSSRGPVLHLFGQVNGPGPAASFAAPQVIPKPEVVATDCGATTFFAFFSEGAWRFCGTSAAAPHAAGAAALLVQAGEAAGGGLEEPEPIRSALLQSASPVGAFDSCAVGAGLVETRGAVEALLAGPGPVPTLACAPPFSSPIDEPPPPTPLAPPPPSTPQAKLPNTKILKHPRKVVRIRGIRARVVFRFGSDQSRVTFLCKLDRQPFKACSAHFVRKLSPGKHVLQVKARSATSGLLDPTPAVFRFRIVRD